MKKNNNTPVEKWNLNQDFFEDLGDKLSKMIHDMKSPLANIHLATEVILTKFKDTLDPEVLYFMEIIFREAKRITGDLDSQVDIINSLKRVKGTTKTIKN